MLRFGRSHSSAARCQGRRFRTRLGYDHGPDDDLLIQLDRTPGCASDERAGSQGRTRQRIRLRLLAQVWGHRTTACAWPTRRGGAAPMPERGRRHLKAAARWRKQFLAQARGPRDRGRRGPYLLGITLRQGSELAGPAVCWWLPRQRRT